MSVSRLEEIDTEVTLLLERFENFGYASEEFWATYDKLMVLLINGIQEARILVADDYAGKWDAISEDLKLKIPSGYWK